MPVSKPYRNSFPYHSLNKEDNSYFHGIYIALGIRNNLAKTKCMGARDGFYASTVPFYTRSLSICDFGSLGKGRGSWNQSLDIPRDDCICLKDALKVLIATLDSMHLIERDLALHSTQDRVQESSGEQAWSVCVPGVLACRPWGWTVGGLF